MDEQCLALLDAIEEQEMLSLAWGYVDGSLSREAAIALWKGDDSGVTGEALLEELLSRRLAFEFKGNRVRSRFAETIRLLSHLRQLFDGRPWFGAPKLVSDFRVDLRRRLYPRRNRPASEVYEANKAALNATAIRRSLWGALAEQPKLQLSGFQERSVARLLTAESDTATIVTAGTGSGKTLAFYLPALLRIGERVELHQYWVKALAIYPRIELLKDQLAEAFRRARGTDTLLKAEGKRPIKVGAYFSSTPNSADHDEIEEKWIKRGVDFVCPWMRCPHCGGELLWKEDDYTAKRERLVCAGTDCMSKIPEEQLVLTRQRLAESPPDILFTTTEMLNQRMSDLRIRRLFGIGQPLGKRPLFALLDEVHTYVGTSGAQSALVLRRWRHLLNAPVTWCGLSATLQEAPRFFSDLTGVPADKVVEISPLDSEMMSEGAEYQVVLRGDPLLQASLLSTTIQASMLIGRMMDTSEKPISNGAFGRRAFVFTDNLDVINRLFDNLRDAEAYDMFGMPDGRRMPLAVLRGVEPADPRRELDGQRWRAPELIGRPLATRLIVGRTSSQDAGVLANADVIVATASLEVGYNDDQVGAVIQHKAPRNMASFLQRKGRAGRSRGMRPFTLTILSDYGRDRIAFQAYEHIFDPTLPAQHLPILNQYVLRMQAVYALFDWLAADAASNASSGWMWSLLSRPGARINASVRQTVDDRLKSLVRGDESTLTSLREHLKRSLQVSDEIVEAILWSPPRPVLLEAVPTLVRRYFRDWEIARPGNPGEKDLLVEYHPLPDFVPRNLFSDLNLPEVQVVVPPATRRHKTRQEPMPIVQALQQLAPGRVTRRFAFERGSLCHWVAIAVDAPDQTMPIGQYAARHEYLGRFEGKTSEGETITLPVYRPWEVAVTQVPTQAVLPTSNASMQWITGFEPRGTVLKVEVPPKSVWFSCVSEVGFYLHRFRGSVAVRRFAHEVQANLRRRTGEALVNVRFSGDGDEPAAVGFEIEVDAFYIDFKLPDVQTLMGFTLPAELRASSKSAYLRYRLLAAKELPPELNSLQREWIYHIFLCAAIGQALEDNCSVGEGARRVLARRPTQSFSEVMRTLFALQDPEAEEAEDPATNDDDAEASTEQRVSRLEERLNESLGRADVLTFLGQLVPEFDEPDPVQFAAWMRASVHETLSEALLQACIDTAPKHAAIDTLVADVDLIADGDMARVWVTETTLGGAGVIQAFADAFALEPRSLFRALESAVAPTDMEMTSHGLKRFLSLACDDTEVADLAYQLRHTRDHLSGHALRENLYTALSNRGVDVSHSLSVSLNTRLLRPGTTRDSDQVLCRLLNEWEGLEERFGVSIGLREFCYVAIGLPGVANEVAQMAAQAGGINPSRIDLISVLSGLLWPRGIEIRQRTLQSYNPFRSRRVTDPALIRQLILSPGIPVVRLDDDRWHESLIQHLAVSGVAQLAADHTNEKKIRGAIMQVIACPVDVGYLQFYPFVERIERGENETCVAFSMREHV